MTSTTRRLPRASSMTVAALPAHHLSEWPRLKIEIALDLQPHWAANRFEFGEDEVAPFLLHAADVAEEAEIMVLGLALGDIPSPVGIRCKKLGVHHRIGYILLGVQRWQAGPWLRDQEFHLAAPCFISANTFAQAFRARSRCLSETPKEAGDSRPLRCPM